MTEDNRHSGKGTIIRNSKGEADNSKRSSNERRRLEEEISSLKRLLQGGEASDIVNDVCRSIKDSF